MLHILVYTSIRQIILICPGQTCVCMVLHNKYDLQDLVLEMKVLYNYGYMNLARWVVIK